MNQIIQNLTRKPAPLKLYCTVVKPLAGGSYQVMDQAGRLHAVDAAGSWLVGAAVTVSQSRIVGAATRFTNPKVYEV